MKTEKAIRALFWFAGFYDGVLGAIFLAAPAAVFDWFRVTPPNHFGYVRLPAALILVFALMFIAVARDPRRNRNLIPYGILRRLPTAASSSATGSARGFPASGSPSQSSTWLLPCSSFRRGGRWARCGGSVGERPLPPGGADLSSR